MSFQSSSSSYKPSNFIVFWGMSTLELATEEMVLGLEHRSVDPKTPYRTFFLDGGTTAGLYQWFAHPASAGEVEFLDTDSGFTGGWDGAWNDIYNYELHGPITMDVTLPNGSVVSYFVYRTDHNDLGPCNWTSGPLT